MRTEDRVPWSDDLTYDYLEHLLQVTQTRFTFHPLRDGPGGDSERPRAILRHDVDVGLAPAVALAEREADWGVAATFLVQADCPLYRSDDAAGRAALHRIVALGHEIGLHVDVGSVAGDGGVDAIAPRVLAMAQRIEDVIGASVESVSFHRPAAWLLRGPDTLAGMVNAYGASFMGAYLSDSEGRWRHGEPIPQIQRVQEHLLQILVHPIWWGRRHLSPSDRLQRFFEQSTRSLPPPAAERFDAELFRAVEPATRSGLA